MKGLFGTGRETPARGDALAQSAQPAPAGQIARSAVRRDDMS